MDERPSAFLACGELSAVKDFFFLNTASERTFWQSTEDIKDKRAATTGKDASFREGSRSLRVNVSRAPCAVVTCCGTCWTLGREIGCIWAPLGAEPAAWTNTL